MVIKYGGQSSQTSWIVSTLDGVGLDGSAERLEAAWQTSTHAAFNRRIYGSLAKSVIYLATAFAVARLVLHRPLRTMGLSFHTDRSHALPYLVLAALVAPLVVAASFTSTFQATYPFYTPTAAEGLWPRLLVWELVYALQFVTLEIFYRGFLVQGWKERFGFMAVFVMVMPYVWIHVGKPMAETLGAIVAGTVLGILALRSGSIWWGVALHVGVAVGIDLLSLGHQGLL